MDVPTPAMDVPTPAEFAEDMSLIYRVLKGEMRDDAARGLMAGALIALGYEEGISIAGWSARDPEPA